MSKPHRKKLIKQCGFLWACVVKNKTNGKCRLCGSSNQVQAHHIVRKGIGIHPGWFMVENGIPLCLNCHYNGVHSMHYSTTQKFQDMICQCLGLDYDKLYEKCKVKERFDVEKLEEIYNDLNRAM